MRKVTCLFIVVTLVCFLGACGGSQPTVPSAPANTPDVMNQHSTTTPAPPTPSTTAPLASDDDNEDKYGGVVKFIETRDMYEPFGLVYATGIARNYSSCFSEAMVNLDIHGNFTPHLAESWDIDMDNKTITFHLRKGVKFTDGSPVNAEAVVWNFDAWHDENRGNEEVDRGMSEAIDEYTVVVHFKNWQNVLFETFSSHSYSTVSMENYLKNGRDYAHENPVGSGPYKLKEYNKGVSVIFERNDDYWMEGKPYLDGVEYYGITDAMVQNTALMTDDPSQRIDFLQCNNAEQSWTLMNAGIDFDYSNMRGAFTYSLAPDSVTEQNNPFYDIRVRQALSYALDRDALVEALGFGIALPAKQVISPGFAGHLPADNPYLEQATYNPEKAKALLAEAGYPDGFTVPLTSLVLYQDWVVAIGELLNNVGIKTVLEFPEPAAYNDMQRNSGWEGLLGFTWEQSQNTGISFYGCWNPEVTSFRNFLVMRPAEYRDMYYIARRSYAVDNELFGDLNEKVLEYQAVIPVYHANNIFFVRNGLKDSGLVEYAGYSIWTPWNAYWEK